MRVAGDALEARLAFRALIEVDPLRARDIRIVDHPAQCSVSQMCHE